MRQVNTPPVLKNAILLVFSVVAKQRRVGRRQVMRPPKPADHQHRSQPPKQPAPAAAGGTRVGGATADNKETKSRNLCLRFLHWGKAASSACANVHHTKCAWKIHNFTPTGCRVCGKSSRQQVGIDKHLTQPLLFLVVGHFSLNHVLAGVRGQGFQIALESNHRDPLAKYVLIQN